MGSINCVFNRMVPRVTVGEKVTSLAEEFSKPFNLRYCYRLIGRSDFAIEIPVSLLWPYLESKLYANKSNSDRH